MTFERDSRYFTSMNHRGAHGRTEGEKRFAPTKWSSLWC